MKSKFRWIYSSPSLKPTHLVVGICIVVVHGWIGAMWVWRMGSVLNLHLWWGTGLVTNTFNFKSTFYVQLTVFEPLGCHLEVTKLLYRCGVIWMGLICLYQQIHDFYLLWDSKWKNAIVAIPGWGMLTPVVSIPEPQSSAPTPGTGAEIGLPWGPEWSSLLKSPSSVTSWLF